MNKGLIYVLSAFILWGVLPIYWKILSGISPIEVLAHRTLWSFVFAFGFLVATKKIRPFLKKIKSKKELGLGLLASIFILINWGSYIYAVNSGKIIEASLGYYINPLLMIVVGVFFFKEKLSKLKMVAIGLASIGVGYLTLKYGKFPTLSFIIAGSFTTYGVIKKKIKLEAMEGLLLDTIMIFPIALIYILPMEFKGIGAITNNSIKITLVLMGTGVISTIPLLLFAKGTKLIPFSTVAIVQYLTPTISLLIGVFLYREEFTNNHLISFAFIWTGLIIYTASSFKRKIKLQNKT